MTSVEKYPEYLKLFRDCEFKVEDGNITMINYTAINFQQLIDLPDKDKMIVMIPFSPLEIHGKYLPLSSDFLESYLALDLLKEVLKKERSNNHYTFVEYPGIPLGTGTNRGHPGTIQVSRRTIYDICYGVFESLVKAGFRKMLVMSVHHGMTHSYTIEYAANKIMKKYKKLDVRIASPNHLIAKTIYMDNPLEVFGKYIKKNNQKPLSEEELKAINCDHHAGIMEIVFLKKISDKLVDPSYKTAPRNVEHMDAQLKGLIMEKWAAHPPKEPHGCGYNADPTFTDSRDWYALFSDMMKDVGLAYIDALVDPNPHKFDEYGDMKPWKQKKFMLEFMRRAFLNPESTRNYLWIFIGIMIGLPWVLYFLK